MEEIRKQTVSRIAEFFNGESTNAEVDTYKKLLDFEKEVKKQLTLTDVGITLTERIVKPEKHILDNEGKRIRMEKPPFN